MATFEWEFLRGRTAPSTLAGRTWIRYGRVQGDLRLRGDGPEAHRNPFWAFVYDTTWIPIASLGPFAPAIAGLAMVGSSVSLMTDSLDFRGHDPHEQHRLLVPALSLACLSLPIYIY